MLLERDESLARLAELLERTADGSGALLLLSGEAGVGKTSLVGALAASVGGRLPVRRGACDDVGTAAALGPLIDAFPELADEIERASAVDRPALFRRLRGVLCEQPALLVLEDLHWADEATLEMVRFLGRRVADIPALVVATFRDEETPSGSPLAVLVGDLATAPAVERMRLTGLSEEAVRRLVAEAGSPLEASRLHGSTDGNPFFVTEVLAGGGTQLPASVRDAVLARTARRSPLAQRVLAAAAVIGPRAELGLLVAVSGAPAEAVDECVRAGVLVSDGEGWGFRHELARRAVEESLAPGARAALHAVVLGELRARGERDDARLAHHAAASGDRDAVVRHAAPAAARSARLGAHLEAVDLYRLALRFAGPSAPERGRLCEALADECFLTNQFQDAYAAREEAMEIGRVAGDMSAVGRNLRSMSRLAAFLRRHAEGEQLGARAVAALEAAGDRRELALAYATLAALRMLAADTDGSVAWGERAVELARQIGDPVVEANALITIGTTRVVRDDREEDWQLLRRGLQLALDNDVHDQAGRAYLNLTALGLRNRRYAQLDRDLAAGAAYCEARDLDAFGHQIELGVIRSLAERSRYADAEERLARAWNRPRLSEINRMALMHVAGLLAAQRDGAGQAQFDEGWQLAERSGEEQMIVVMASVRAEAAWIGGRFGDGVAEVERAWPLAVAQGSGWTIGELAWWSAICGAPRELPLPAAEPFRLLLEGEWRAAAAAWERVGCPLWVAYALGCSPDLADGRQAVGIAADIGAHAARSAILRERQRRGLPVPQGPRSTTRGNPLQLTRRELEVLELLVAGLSNSAIARRLFLSERTVAHHVSAVLQKLGEPSRSRAVTVAIQRRIVAPPVAETAGH